MRPPGSPSQLERRRRRAIERLKRGLTQSAVAAQLGCAESSVSRWRQAYARAGPTGLASHPIPGRPSKLAPAQMHRLVQVLRQGPVACGYATDLWTLPRIAEQIARAFHVRYHPGHVWRLMRGLGWSCQQPERRALQRNEAAIARWTRAVWPRIKKR